MTDQLVTGKHSHSDSVINLYKTQISPDVHHLFYTSNCVIKQTLYFLYVHNMFFYPHFNHFACELCLWTRKKQTWPTCIILAFFMVYIFKNETVVKCKLL